MQQDPTQERPARIATGCNLAAACCFLVLATRVSDGATGYAIAGGLFAAAAIVNFVKWRRASKGAS
jgi:hypothetical protein